MERALELNVGCHVAFTYPIVGYGTVLWFEEWAERRYAVVQMPNKCGLVPVPVEMACVRESLEDAKATTDRTREAFARW